MKVNELRTLLERQKGKKDQMGADITSLELSLKEVYKKQIHHEQAREIVRQVGIKTQQQLQFHISDITSLALEAVFPEPYKLVLEFVQRRNKTECDIYFTRGEFVVDPKTGAGGGTVDIAAFALRIACWSLNNPHTRPTIILDEPFKWVSEEYKELAAEMIKEVSTKLGIQIIMVTHEPLFAARADKVFEVKKSIKQISKVI